MAYADIPYHGGKNQPEQVTDEYLTCAICQIPGFRQPKVLLCGHIFCLRCLESYWGTGPNGLISLGQSRPPYDGERGRPPLDNPCRECGIDRVGVNPPDTHCPLCHVQVKIPLGGLHALPNYLFGNCQIDRLLRRHNKYPMPGVNDGYIYNISDYNLYGQSRTACFTLPQPQWHGWNIAK